MQKNILNLVTAPLQDFSPRQATAQLAGTREINKGGLKSGFCVRAGRDLREGAGLSFAWNRSKFSCAANFAIIALKWVALVTSLPPEEPAAQWLRDNRAALGHREKRPAPAFGYVPSRRPLPGAPTPFDAGNGNVSPFPATACARIGRSRDRKPQHKTTTDFFYRGERRTSSPCNHPLPPCSRPKRF